VGACGGRGSLYIPPQKTSKNVAIKSNKNTKLGEPYPQKNMNMTVHLYSEHTPIPGIKPHPKKNKESLTNPYSEGEAPFAEASIG
jgi:hypothetical protein